MSLLRWLSLGALLYGVYEVAKTSPADLRTADLTHAFWLAYCVILGLVSGLLWVPVFAERLLGAPTDEVKNTGLADPPGRLLALIRRLDARGSSRLARWLCFVEGVRHPWRPAPFVIGMKHARPGSWLERVYAREVYRFTNVDNAVLAYQVLRRHGQTPGLHPRDEVNRLTATLKEEP